MAKCHRNNVDSLILHRIPSASSSSTSGNSFSVSTLRRIIFDAITCGGSSRYRQNLREENDDENETYFTKSATIGGDLGSDDKKSEKLSDLINSAIETKKKEESLEILKRVVRDLQTEHGDGDGDGEKKLAAASEIRLLAKDNTEARVTLAMLGAIPPLVSMIDDDSSSSIEDSQIASVLYALLNLGIGNDSNKAAIVKAGAIHKMMKLIDSSSKPVNQAISDAIIANFLGLSALDSNKPILGSSGALVFLVKTLEEITSSSQAREDALRALYNLSIYHQNVSFILETDLIPFLLNTLGDMEVSGRILSILMNVVLVPEGRKVIGEAVEAFPILVDVLNWNDSQGCQEKAIYILMLMAHKGYRDRKAMIEAGIESLLLELTLVGSALVQKRASRILECLKAVDKGKQVSAPIYGTSSSLGAERAHHEIRMSDEKKAVKELVQQSLKSNMKRIVKRANLPQDFVTSQHFSKSLTF